MAALLAKITSIWLGFTGYRTIGVAVIVMAVGAAGVWFGGNVIANNPRWTALGIIVIGGLQLWLRFQTKGPIGWTLEQIKKAAEAFGLH